MGRSISSNTNPKVPITFLYTAHMMGGYSFCHAYVYCHGKKPEEVWGFIEAAYLEKTKEEIRKIAERWGSCLLDVNDDDLGCAMMEDGEFVWNIAPENQDDCEEDFEGFYPDKIRSYHVDYVIDGDTILITYMPPVYWANFGERLVDVSHAMYGAIKKANERFNVSYYIYEGYAHIDTCGSDADENVYCSGQDVVPNKDRYIGSVFAKMWQDNEEFVYAVNELIYGMSSDNEKDCREAEQVMNFIHKYEDVLEENVADRFISIIENENTADVFRRYL